MKLPDLHHFVLIYDCPAGFVTAREFPDHASATAAYEDLDTDGFGGLYDVTVVGAESYETLEKLHARPVILGKARGAS
jgi:hypothetical protein